MWKYLLIFALIFGLTVFVSYKDQDHADRRTQQASTPNNTSVSAVADNAHPTESKENPQPHFLRWHRFFAWPEGITAWALFLTLMAIAEQTKHTARAADIANKTLISTLRPKLIIRKIEIHRGTGIPTIGMPDADPWKVNFVFANIGRGQAHILDYGFAISRLESEHATEISYINGNAEPIPFFLEPGEDRQLSIDIDGELISILRHIGTDGLARGYQKTDHIYFFGSARYTDDLGTIRNLEACRHYDNASTRFKAVDDPDRDYSD